MSTPLRIAAFVLGLAAVFGLALGAGRLAGPVAEPVAAHEEDAGHGAADTSSDTVPAAQVPGGLQVSEAGYTLRLGDDQVRGGRVGPVRFTVTGPDGAAVTAYDVEHAKRLHLIAVRRDFRGYQHVHPTLAADGTWTARLGLSPGSWRLFADFTPTGGPALTLGTDLHVRGDFQPVAPPAPADTARLGSHTVTLGGDLVAGESTVLTARVERFGRPVTDLQPYLAAYGHLVALREGDLAYLHVHPEEGPSGPDIAFALSVPSEGRYRFFLDFKHLGAVRTAAFTLATEGAPGGSTGSTHQSEEDDHGH